MDNQLSKDLSSYVSFALKLKPTVNFPGHYDDKGKFVQKSEHVDLDPALSKDEVFTLEALIDKYKLLKPYLRPNSTLDSLKIVPKEYKEPRSDPAKGIEYKKFTVHAGQLEIAKRVSRSVDEIYKAHSGGNEKEAKKQYNEFNRYLERTRKELLGDFRTVQEVEDGLALYGVGLNHADNGGAVIFVIAEIFIACPLQADIFNERAIGASHI
jgi:hypothetical protein